MTVLAELLRAEGVVAAPPATDEAIAEVAKLSGAELPAEVLTLWRSANGIELESIDAEILSCEAAAKVLRDSACARAFVENGLLPLVHDHQSNYCALALREPLAPRVLFVPHDDGPKLLYARLDSCLRAVLAGIGSGDSLDILLHETDGDYAPDQRRSPSDQAAARALMATPGERNEWIFATQLLDESNLDEFARLLETDHFVRRDVRDRMQKMQAPEIRKLLGRDRKAFESFSADLATAASAAGLKVKAASRSEVLNVGGIFIELEGFFHQRNQPDAMSKAIARIRELIQRNQRAV